MPLFRELLGTIAEDGAHLLSVCDEQGTMLWVEGHRQVLRRAERMNFVPGARWSERTSGTNAPGTALAVDHAVQIFGAEHYCRPVQSWTCAAAPVHDPRTGRVIGAVDLTGGDHLASPHSLALVQATARAAEACLAAPEAEPRASGPPPPDVCTHSPSSAGTRRCCTPRRPAPPAGRCDWGGGTVRSCCCLPRTPTG